MAEVARLVEEHIRKRGSAIGEPSFANCLTLADKFEAHGLGIVIEELMSTDELADLQRGAEPLTP